MQPEEDFGSRSERRAKSEATARRPDRSGSRRPGPQPRTGSGRPGGTSRAPRGGGTQRRTQPEAGGGPRPDAVRAAPERRPPGRGGRTESGRRQAAGGRQQTGGTTAGVGARVSTEPGRPGTARVAPERRWRGGRPPCHRSGYRTTGSSTAPEVGRVPVKVHLGGCGKSRKAPGLSEATARRALAEGVAACQVCRPETERADPRRGLAPVHPGNRRRRGRVALHGGVKGEEAP
ncbi:DUF6233 domain-containing protein [Streptomyces changanensis]|uniref:DUF6233 domain-containing protein n=1 Tax=Streptomyces TaxID=1883 RepID=UPI0038B4468E